MMSKASVTPLGKRARVDGNSDAAKVKEGGRKRGGEGSQNASIRKVQKIKQKSLSAIRESRPESGKNICVAEVENVAELGGRGWDAEEDGDGDGDGYDDGGDSICAFCDDGGKIIW